MESEPIDSKQVYSDIYREDGFNYGAHDDACTSRPASQLAVLDKYFRALNVSSSSSVVEVGCGSGRLHMCHPRWRGYEYSPTAIEIGKRQFGGTLAIFEADARALPLDDNSVDFLFSFAALEHVPHVERAFHEIVRVVKPGGFALLSPAWNCRSWTVKKLQQRPYRELSFVQMVGKALIPVREHLFFRMATSLPGRVYREILLASTSAPIDLQYVALSPDFSLWERFEHIADDDAFVSIDAHAALCYFGSRGWRSSTHPSFGDRFSCRGGEIVVQKPSVGGHG